MVDSFLNVFYCFIKIIIIFWMGLNGVEIWFWPRQQESNLYFTLRRHTFYPLNYGECLRAMM